jgi:hypothetical protein
MKIARKPSMVREDYLQSLPIIPFHLLVSGTPGSLANPGFCA